MLDIQGLSVRYGGVSAVRSVSLTVGEGETVALIGPNGAGKTSLLRALSGLSPVVGGTVSFAGQDLFGVAPHKRARIGLAHAPEGRMIIAPLSVEENLELGAYRQARKESRSRLEEMYSLFPRLHERRQVQAGMLSGGEQQMLTIARALMSHPNLLLLDEPSMGLAPIVVEDVLASISTAMTAGVAILLAEQNAQLALELASYVHVLVSGEVVESGKPSDLSSDLLDHYLE